MREFVFRAGTGPQLIKEVARGADDVEGRALESSEAESRSTRLGWEWLWSTPWPEIPERPLPAGWAKLRL
jgi:hypothetical protein